MDSLLASYGSDDEDEQEEKPVMPVSNAAPELPPPPKVSLFGRLPAPRNSASGAPPGSLFASLPPPQLEAKKKDGVKSEEDGTVQKPPQPGLFAKLPPPKIEELGTEYGNPSDGPSKPTLFAALPPPKVEFDSSRVKLEITHSNPKVKKKQPVAFKPPIDVSILEDDDDDWRPAQKKAKAEPLSTTTGGGGLSSLLPAPKHSLGLGSTLGAAPTSGGRRAAMEVAESTTKDVKTEPAVLNSRISTASSNVKNEAHASQDQVQYDNSAYAVDESAAFVPQVQYSNEPYEWTAPQPAQETPHNGTSQYEPQNWQYSGSVPSYSTQASYASANSAPVADPVAQVLQAERRRGREDRMAAPNVIEVKQADLTGGAKLREDQIRSTGIAFGPAYLPVSSKDKPSKLQRRKHQIGTLLQDSKAREMELLDRRAKGNLTKAETQAKYGW